MKCQGKLYNIGHAGDETMKMLWSENKEDKDTLKKKLKTQDGSYTQNCI